MLGGYWNSADGLFYEESTFTTAIDGDDLTLYKDLSSNQIYVFNGTQFTLLNAEQYAVSQDEMDDILDDAGAITPTPSRETVVLGYWNSADGQFYKESSFTTTIVGDTLCLYRDIPSQQVYLYNGDTFELVNGDTYAVTQSELDDILTP